MKRDREIGTENVQNHRVYWLNKSGKQSFDPVERQEIDKKKFPERQLQKKKKIQKQYYLVYLANGNTKI